MKTKILTLLVAMLLVFQIVPAASAESADTSLAVYVYGNKLEFDQNPVIENGRTLVPMRGIFEALGMAVQWDENTRKVTATNDETTIELVVGENLAKVNGEEVVLDVPAKIMSDRTMVPLRFVGESTGNHVWWNDTMNKVRPRIVISPAHSDELTEALENFDKTLYSESLLNWLANLYDPEIGGFYFKTSAKETEGFLPDKESTAKQLGTAAKMLGCTTQDIINEMTPEMREKMLKFAQTYQSDEDGYWYEEPWGPYISESKKLYQTSSATQLITFLGGKPLYPTAQERLAQSKAGTETMSTSASGDNRYASKADFKAWFDSLTWDTSLYGAGSLMLSNMGDIISAGYYDYAVELISSKIDPETGMLGKPDKETGKFTNHEVSQDAMSGTYKILGYWGQSYYPSMKGLDLDYPYTEALIDSVIEIVMSDDVEYTNACHVSNAISLISLYTSQTTDSAAYNKLRKKLPELINMTTMKAQRHMTSDGSYTYSPGIGAGGNQGSVHAYCLADGETSGASMMLALRENVYNAVGMEMPPLFDGKYTAKDFVEMLKKVEPTQKINFATDISYNFNDFELGALPQGEGFRSTGDISVVEDPEYIGEYSIKISSPGGERPVLLIDAGTRSGKGFVCEFDLRVTSPKVYLQFEFGSYFNSTALHVSDTAGKYRIVNQTYPSLAEYKRIKIEYNVADGVGENKFYVDGQLINTTTHNTNGYPNMPALENIPALQIRPGTDDAFTAYIDNFEFHEIK
ncbi:MAG: copper amine oxidase N-terminal domain-containing protein [Clostridia bacterium]|nr:copper amine oxidase N-terminal domain-containing protein [Clostridia bacterium]